MGRLYSDIFFIVQLGLALYPRVKHYVFRFFFGGKKPNAIILAALAHQELAVVRQYILFLWVHFELFHVLMKSHSLGSLGVGGSALVLKDGGERYVAFHIFEL